MRDLSDAGGSDRSVLGGDVCPPRRLSPVTHGSTYVRHAATVQ